MKDGEPHFVAADVCRALEISNVSDALSRLDDDEKSLAFIPAMGIGSTDTHGGQEMLVVNEPGLYHLIFTSRKPEAHKFQRWVYHEVLPSIRKTGAYTVDNPRIPTDQLIKSLVEIVWHDERVLTTAQLAEFYECAPENIRDNFRKNGDRFVSGKHFFKLEGDDLKTFRDYTEIFRLVNDRTPSLYLWTKCGAARHAKMLNTDKAWEVFELLEDNYFDRPAIAPDNNTDPLAQALSKLADVERDKLALEREKLPVERERIAAERERLTFERKKFNVENSKEAKILAITQLLREFAKVADDEK